MTTINQFDDHPNFSNILTYLMLIIFTILGYPDYESSWEAEDSLNCDDLIAEYNLRVARKKMLQALLDRQLQLDAKDVKSKSLYKEMFSKKNSRLFINDEPIEIIGAEEIDDDFKFLIKWLVGS